MKEKFYITTAIDYVNGPPHLGHALEKVQADAIARYQRLLQKDVFFLTGTDEHGAKIVKAAEAQGKKVEEFVDEMAENFRNLTKVLDISNDDFIRTSDKKRHWPAAQKMWNELSAKGDIYKANYKGLYCIGCEAFITQKDLIDGKCAIHNQKPEEIDEENYFFKLSRYGGAIKKALESGDMKIVPDSRKNEILNLIGSGLEDTSFSRPAKDISWGIPVPGDDTQTMYVWADALVNYISALGYENGNPLRRSVSEASEKFKKYWPADIHVIGKDILRFHSLIWPAMLVSAGLPLPRNLFVHGHITVDGKKMSKSLGNVIDPFDLCGRYTGEALRYFLIREVPPTDDGDITEEKFRESYNANLANGLGNLISRIFKMAFSYFDGRLEKPNDVALSQVPLKEKEHEFYSIPYVFEHFVWPEYKSRMDSLEINKAADIVWSAISSLDGYIQDYQPFKLVSSDKEKTAAVLWSLLNGLANISWLISPFMPKTAEKLMDGLFIDHTKIEPWTVFYLKPMENLFPRKE